MTLIKNIYRIIICFIIVFTITLLGVSTEDILHNIPLKISLSRLHHYYTPSIVGILATIIYMIYWRSKFKQLQSINQYTSNLKALLDVNSSFVSTLELNKLLQIIIDKSTQFIKLDTGAIYLLEEETLYLGATTPPLPPNIPEELRHDKLINHPHIQESLSGKKPLTLINFSKEELSDSEKIIVEQRNLKSLLFIPLIIENRPVGILILGTTNKERLFTSQEIDMCATFSVEAALAIENARLFKESELTAKLLTVQNREIKKINDELNDRNASIEEINEELTIAKQKAEENDRLKTAFLNNISHEIRTPLNAVVGFANLIADEEIAADKIKIYSKAIIKSSDKLLDVISDVVETSQIHTQQSKVFLSDIEFNREIIKIVNRFSQIANEKGIELNMQLEDKTCNVKTDVEKLKRIIYHIIDNAIKFTNKGSVNINCKTVGESFIFTCNDTGVGISSEYQEVIFEPFRQINKTNTTEYGGNGLGLAIVKAYTNLLGGTLTLNSKPDQGTSIQLSLPINMI